MARKKTSQPSPTPKKTTRSRPLDERIAIHAEWGKTARFFMIIVGVVAGAWILMDGIVRILEKPPWIQALGMVLGFLTTLIAPSVVIYHYRRSIQKFTIAKVSRLRDFETQKDPSRTSSGLGKDGSDAQDSET